MNLTGAQSNNAARNFKLAFFLRICSQKTKILPTVKGLMELAPHPLPLIMFEAADCFLSYCGNNKSVSFPSCDKSAVLV